MTGKFWYSQKQKELCQRIDGSGWRPYYARIKGVVLEYTEMMAGEVLDKKSNWDDAVYLGECFFVGHSDS